MEWVSGAKPFNIGLYQLSTCRYRPIGKSVYLPAPWEPIGNPTVQYIPTEMTPKNMKLGLEKSHEDELQFEEKLVRRAEIWMKNYLQGVWTRSKESMVTSYSDALEELTMDKSPGYPYYYDCLDKAEALEKYGDIICEKTCKILEGQQIPCFFSLTEKSELRTEEKVKQGKTRVFMAGDIHHLLACVQLFLKQNEDLIDKRGMTPSTVGIQIPGPEFVRTLLKLASDGPIGDGDVSGCDLRFKLRIARVIRNLRASFLPDRFRDAVNWLYDCVYAGNCAGLGGIFLLYGNKSGWFNTSHDNTLMTWICFIIACFHFFPERDPLEVMRQLINGDDLAVRQLLGDFHEFCCWLKQYNFIVEANDWTPRQPQEVVYLSHHIETRYVAGFGSFLCAAGNLDKILCSLNYIKKSKTLTFQESCVAHLLGLRMCLFPWAVEFQECDELLSKYLDTISLTPFIRLCLKARLSEIELACLHTRVEGFSFLPDIPEQVMQSFCLDGY